jgi:hypothetical protein
MHCSCKLKGSCKLGTATRCIGGLFLLCIGVDWLLKMPCWQLTYHCGGYLGGPGAFDCNLIHSVGSPKGQGHDRQQLIS